MRHVGSPKAAFELVVAALLVVSPATVGWIAGLLADSTVPTLLVLLFEPALWIALGTLVLLALSRRRLLLAAGAGSGLLLLAVLVRWPTPLAVGPPDDARGLRPARVCVEAVSQPRGALSVRTWNAKWSATAARLEQLEADVLFLQNVPDPDALREAVAARGGDVVIGEVRPGRSAAIVLREGRFLPCWAGDEGRRTVVTASGQGVALAGMAELPGHGVVPLVSAHLPRPEGPLELLRWSSTLNRAARRVAGLVAVMGAESAIVGGDTNAHGTFRFLLARMAATPLHAAPAVPTWPARIGPIPMLPLYHADRVWHGDEWALRETAAVRVSGHSDHLAVAVALEGPGGAPEAEATP